jgi:hypothetical protein
VLPLVFGSRLKPDLVVLDLVLPDLPRGGGRAFAQGGLRGGGMVQPPSRPFGRCDSWSKDVG